MSDGCVIVSILPGAGVKNGIKKGGRGIKKPRIKKCCLIMAILTFELLVLLA